MSKKARIGIWGWWQGGNLGDNWIKKILAEYFPFAELIPTSTVDFSGYDFIICGGGGLFIYDVINPWNSVEGLQIPYGTFGLGAEFPHTTDIAKRLEENATFFFVRDQYSIDCMKLSQNARSYDCTFLHPLKWTMPRDTDENKVFFVWRDGHELVKESEQFREYIRTNGNEKSLWDTYIRNNFETIIEDDFQTQDDDLESRIAGCGFVISGRYHGIMAAIHKGLPFVAIDICPKIRALVEECGLEEYCIKISEIDKIESLIKNAKANVEKIRDKEKKYTELAHEKMMKDLQVVYREVFKVCKPMRGIHYGSYWMKENDIINVMADDLADLCELKKIDLHVYEQKPDARVKCLMKEPNTLITILDHKKIVRDVKRYKPDFIILNSGGLVLEDETFEYLKANSIKTIGLELSDPDVFPYNGAIYAHKFDFFYTNSKYSLINEYNSEKVNIGLMPFAASQKHHFYMPEVEKIYDLVIVGHARPDRQEIIDQLRSMCKVGTYGDGWDMCLGTVNGAEHVKAINTGKMYLSFSKTVAGFNNVKVGLFEAMACKQVVITEYMEELEDYFEIGREILCFKNVGELKEIISYYSTHSEELEQIRENAYARFLQEHTYVERWVDVLRKVMGNVRIISEK